LLQVFTAIKKGLGNVMINAAAAAAAAAAFQIAVSSMAAQHFVQNTCFSTYLR
jgi:hypothetical protein